MTETKSKLVALVVEGCLGCEDLKREAEKHKLQLEYMDIGSDRKAAAIALKLELTEVPALVSLEETGLELKVCKLDNKLKVEKCITIPKEELEKMLKEVE